MRWTPGRRSENLEDRRGISLGRVGGGLGLGGLAILFLLSVIFKQDFFRLLDTAGGGDVATRSGPVQSSPEEEKLVDFVSFVFDNAQATWAELLPQKGVRYENAKLVLFRDAVESACGYAESVTGPFYCPRDRKVYIDLGFFHELDARFGAPGDFAQAYVLAHEMGHHVQNLLGIDARMRMAQQRDPAAANQLSVRMELQADCYAGVWGRHTAQKNLLEEGDVEEGLAAAAAIGDDRLQRMSTGHVSPDSFTHGTSAERVAWFKRGLQSGRVEDCDTFAER